MVIERIKARRGTREGAEVKKPILAAGEPGYFTDTKEVAFGDGQHSIDIIPPLESTANKKTEMPDDPTDQEYASLKLLKSELVTLYNLIVDLLNALNPDWLQDEIDCSANPLYPASSKGWGWQVTTAGRIGGDEGEEVEIGDLIICKKNSLAGTQEEVGENFFVLQTNLIGAVIGPKLSTDGKFPLFNGTSGNRIKNSTYGPDSFDAAGDADTALEAAAVYADQADRAVIDIVATAGFLVAQYAFNGGVSLAAFLAEVSSVGIDLTKNAEFTFKSLADFDDILKTAKQAALGGSQVFSTSDVYRCAIVSDYDAQDFTYLGKEGKSADSAMLDGKEASHYQAAFGDQVAGSFYAGPATGSAVTPGFRAITVSDLPPFANIAPKTNAIFASGSNTYTLTDAKILSGSLVEIFVTSAQKGFWSPVATTGSLTITSSAVETINVSFQYRIA